MIRLALALLLLAGSGAWAQDRRSAYADMSADLQALQDDDLANPGLLWAEEGQRLWSLPAPGGACADCHGDPASLAGVAARYPVWDQASDGPVDLEGRIALCQSRHQGTEPWPRGGPEAIALATLVALQSRGLPVAPDPDPRLDPWRARGLALFTARMGQLNLACASCHDDNAGGHLAAATIPEGHPTGYPQYRLEWQEVGPLSRRFGNCLFGMRAEPFAAGGPEYLALEAYLMARAAGMAMEAPAVRP